MSNLISCVYVVMFLTKILQVFVVKSMIIQLTSSWMSSLPVKRQEVVRVTVDFKVGMYMCVWEPHDQSFLPGMILNLSICTSWILLITSSISVLDGQAESIRKVDLTEYYENSDQFRSVQGQLEPIAGSAVSRRNGETPSYATGFLWQVNFWKC
jgi:hypothetical protein